VRKHASPRAVHKRAPQTNTTLGCVQLGFAMLEVGSVRVFHMQNILIKVRSARMRFDQHACSPPHLHKSHMHTHEHKRACVQNVVDGAITIGSWFLFGYALYSDGVAFSGNTVRPSCPPCLHATSVQPAVCVPVAHASCACCSGSSAQHSQSNEEARCTTLAFYLQLAARNHLRP
jgi:hypothetical protein